MKETPYPSLTAVCDELDASQHGVISPDLFRITGHERRFRSLIHTYRLEPEPSSHITFTPFVQLSQSVKPDEEAEKGTPCPQWHLWLTEISDP